MEIRVPGIGWWRRQQEAASAQLRGAPAPSAAQPEPVAPVQPAAPVPAETADSISDELRARREEIARLEERALADTRSLEIQRDDLERRALALDDRGRTLDQQAEELKQAKRVQRR